MMDWYVAEKLAAYRQRELESEAETHRLLKEAFSAYGDGEPLTPYDRALARLGHWLVARGKRLQERNGQQRRQPAHTAPAPQTQLLCSHNRDTAIGQGFWGM